jgi:drug/metabolite transporter (DMT)-like permease
MEQEQVSQLGLAKSRGLARGRYRDIFWLLVLGALWGSSYLFIKVTVAEVPATTLVISRLGLAAAIMWVLLLVTGQAVPRDRKVWGAFAGMGLLSGAVPWTLITWAEQYISSGLAALLQATMPIFTVILALVLAEDERLTPLKILGVVVGFVGVGVLLLPDLRQGLQASLLGQLAIIASSLSYAGGAIFARKWLRGQPPLLSTTGQLTTGLLFMLPLGLLSGRALYGLPSMPAIASWLALTIFGTVFAYIIYYKLIQWSSATFVSTVTYIIPVWGLFLGALVLHEPLTASLLASLALILLGILLVRK